MTDIAVYIVTGVLAVVALLLFMRSKDTSESFTEQKRNEIKRKRAALRQRTEAEAAERSKE